MCTQIFLVLNMCNKNSQMYKSSVICNFHQIHIWKCAFVSVLLICKPPRICVLIFETHLARFWLTNAFFLQGGRLQRIRCLSPLQPITWVPPHEGFRVWNICVTNMFTNLILYGWPNEAVFEGGTSGIFRFVVKSDIPGYNWLFDFFLILPLYFTLKIIYLVSLFSAQPHVWLYSYVFTHSLCCCIRSCNYHLTASSCFPIALSFIAASLIVSWEILSLSLLHAWFWLMLFSPNSAMSVITFMAIHKFTHFSQFCDWC